MKVERISSFLLPATLITGHISAHHYKNLWTNDKGVKRDREREKQSN